MVAESSVMLTVATGAVSLLTAEGPASHFDSTQLTAHWAWLPERAAPLLVRVAHRAVGRVEELRAVRRGLPAQPGWEGFAFF